MVTVRVADLGSGAGAPGGVRGGSPAKKIWPKRMIFKRNLAHQPRPLPNAMSANLLPSRAPAARARASHRALVLVLLVLLGCRCLCDCLVLHVAAAILSISSMPGGVGSGVKKGTIRGPYKKTAEKRAAETQRGGEGCR